jgi:phosphopantothenoylcysteine synthetase/decarboxylase
MPRREIALVVTGSVAAVKAFLLADALRARGFSPRFIMTEAAWPFLRMKGKYKATAEQLAEFEKQCHPERSEGSQAPAASREILRFAQDDIKGILIAPASADFIRQVVLGDTPLGAEIKGSGKPVMIAPAMNVMMWRHPAVQKNIKAAMAAGMHILGPAAGGMACGDSGHGRMLEPADIAMLAEAVLNDAKTAPAGMIDTPRLPQTTRKPCRRILLVNGKPEQLLQEGFDVQCVVEPDMSGDAPALEKLTRHPVVSAHHQLYPKDGMEHIWLAEDSDAVVMHLTPALAAEMARGAAESFIGCIYLATKRPVIVIPAPGCAREDIAALASHGAAVTDEKNLVATIRSLEREQPPEFAGMSFLILNGSPRETVDSFRFYVNAARPADHGLRVANELKARGAQVTLVETGGTAAELIEACRSLHAKPVHAVLQLANISHFACPAPASHKISKTGVERARLFDVVGNIDVIGELKIIFGAGKVLGYNNYQEWTDDTALPAARKVAGIARKTA